MAFAMTGSAPLADIYWELNRAASTPIAFSAGSAQAILGVKATGPIVRLAKKGVARHNFGRCGNIGK